MIKLKVLVVDDEPAAQEGIRLRLEQYDDVEVVGVCRSAGDALERVHTLAPDILFLDVEMPGTSGIEMLQRLPPGLDPAVVLVTAYSEFALAAFEVDAVDYLLKPIDDDRFEVALDRARRRCQRVRNEQLALKMRSLLTGDDVGAADHMTPLAEPEAAIRRFLVRHEARELAIDITRIVWIEAAGDYIRLHSLDGDFLLRDSLRHVEQRLRGSFGRVHRSALVCFDQVHELRPTAHGDFDVLLHNGQTLRMSRTYRDSFRRGLETATSEA